MIGRVLFFLTVGTCACAPGTTSAVSNPIRRTLSCDSVADTLLPVAQTFEGLEGPYDFILVKRDSVRTPAATLVGKLFLWRALPTDSNSKGQRPYGGDNSNYFGTTNVDLAAADADFSGFWRGVHNPQRSDVDAIHPPIRAFVIRNRVAGTSPFTLFWLVVGTVMNDRDRGGGLDGMGVVFDVKKISNEGLFGTWDRAGIVQTGHGYFCAYRNANLSREASPPPNTR